MRILRDLPRPGETGAPLALCVGNFDGVHRGHRTLADLVRRRAADDNLQSAVLSFEPHPLAVLGGKPVRRLGGAGEKITYLSDINILYLLRFTKQFSSQSAEEFAALLFSRLRAKYVAAGENFRFGRGRRGDLSLLRREGKRYGAEVAGVPLQTIDGAAISSGRIRECLRRGDFTAAAALLGRPWILRGRVIRGRGLGRTLGYPTANLNLHFLPVCEGIFVAAAFLDGKILPAALSIGGNPTVGGGELRAEAFLPDFSGDLYGRRLVVRPLHKLRDEQKFADTAELRAAMAADVSQVREWWKKNAAALNL
ncbi:MAG: riboflavin biosynthesis protein RibF [Gammaproteobacteria bacterium]